MHIFMREIPKRYFSTLNQSRNINESNKVIDYRWTQHDVIHVLCCVPPHGSRKSQKLVDNRLRVSERAERHVTVVRP